MKFAKYNICVEINYQDDIQDNGTDEPIETGSGETENFYRIEERCVDTRQLLEDHKSNTDEYRLVNCRLYDVGETRLLSRIFHN